MTVLLEYLIILLEYIQSQSRHTKNLGRYGISRTRMCSFRLSLDSTATTIPSDSKYFVVIPLLSIK